MIDRKTDKRFVAFYKGSMIDWQLFERHVTIVRHSCLNDQLNGEACTKVLNLCEDHYHFMVLFIANMLECLTTVMPSNRSQGEIERLLKTNEGMLSVSDTDIDTAIQLNPNETYQAKSINLSTIPKSLVAAELYSSGSTGTPVVNPKTWQQLVIGAEQVFARFSLDKHESVNIIATVPPQHMFGFEMSIVMPLVCGAAIYHKQPFYPLDIQQAMREVSSPRVMVTTPIQLKACKTIKEKWPEIEFILSATAPMPKDVANNAEVILNTVVNEIYGCSEVGAIATRRMTVNTDWEILPVYSLSVSTEGAVLTIPTSDNPITLPDTLELLSEHSFRLQGRNADLIKIGGKRGSLIDVTQQIIKLEGVDDAVVFLPEEDSIQRQRLVALVVAPGMAEAHIREELKRNIDPVFLPRPICMVSALPRNSMGKLPLKSVLSAYAELLKDRKTC